MSPLSQVYYQDGKIVEVRRHGEWHDLREFVTPLDPEVQKVYSRIGPDVRALLDWVCRNISYRSDDGEFWSFPGETLRRRAGDCDCSAILLGSLLRNFTDAYVVLGTYRGLAHAWCMVDSTILETTYTAARAVPDPQNYVLYAVFNDMEAVEFWPGALKELFALERQEARKLELLSLALGA